MIAKVNSDLVGKFVNIASRCAGFIGKRFEGRLGEVDADACAEFAAAWTEGRIAAAYDERDYSRALREIMRLADLANQYVNDHKPWELAKQEGQEARLHVGVQHRADDVPRPHPLPQAGTAGARRAGRSLPRHPGHGLAGRLGGAARRPRHPGLQPPDDPRRAQADRRACSKPTAIRSPRPPPHRSRRNPAGRRRKAASSQQRHAEKQQHVGAGRGDALAAHLGSTTSPRSTCASRGSSMPSTSKAPTSSSACRSTSARPTRPATPGRARSSPASSRPTTRRRSSGA